MNQPQKIQLFPENETQRANVREVHEGAVAGFSMWELWIQSYWQKRICWSACT